MPPKAIRRGSWLSHAILSAGISACLASWIVGTRIPYFDYDDASQGIFVNDLSFRHAMIASFEGRPDRQDVYRTGFAAQRLAYSLPLSWIERGLSLPRWDVEGLLRAAALVFGWVGSWLAARALMPPSSSPPWERWSVVAAVAAHPSVALLARTGASFYLLAYALFWAGVLASFRWLDSDRAVWMYVGGGVASLGLLNPYPPLLCWPLAAGVAAAAERRLRPTVLSPHLCAGAAAGALGAALATMALGSVFDTSPAVFLARLAAFRADRGHAVALAQLAVSPADKVVKLLDQELFSRVDRLGDLSRGDWVWVLGSIQPVVLFWAAAAGAGLVLALRRRSALDRRALAVAATVLAFFLTVSFPEGRYVLVLLPCWAAFAIRGVERIVRSPEARRITLGIFLLLLVAGTELSIRRAYLPEIRRVWEGSEGMRAAAPYVDRLARNVSRLEIAMPYPLRFEPELFFRMVMPPGAEWIPRPRFAERVSDPARDSGMAALAYADDLEWIRYLTDRGFTREATVRGEASGREIVLLSPLHGGR